MMQFEEEPHPYPTSHSLMDPMSRPSVSAPYLHNSHDLHAGFYDAEHARMPPEYIAPMRDPTPDYLLF